MYNIVISKILYNHIYLPIINTLACGSFCLMALAAAKEAVPAPTRTYGT